MFDFRRDSTVPNYLGSKQQRRLLVVLALVGVLAILLVQATGELRSRIGFGPSGPSGGAALAIHADPIETDRYDDSAVSTVPADDSPAPADAQALFPGVRPDYLRAVEDDTVFRVAEADAWFHLLALLQTTDQRDLEQASLGRVGFLQLDQQTDAYRGRLVTIDGTVRGAKLVSAPPNGYSIKQYYQLWLQPQHDSPALVAVYALTVPDGFPLGTGLQADCAVTGFFFKRWAYPIRDGIATAPLVLARTVDWSRPPPIAPQAPPGEQFAWALIIASILAVAIVGFLIARGRAARGAWQAVADGEKLQASLLSREDEHPANRDHETENT